MTYRSGKSQTMILILIDPTASLLGFHHQLIISESSIHKCVDEGTGKILFRRIDVGRGG